MDAGQMGQFVHDFYVQNLDTMKQAYQLQMKDFIEAQKVRVLLSAHLSACLGP